jgi:hypothetical protein
MNRWLYMLRFFVVVPPMPVLMIGAFGAVTGTIAVIIALDPSRAVDALTPILLLQVFACASGFDVPARRGHYDLLLTHTGSRRLVLFGHWLASSCPGVVSWLLLAAACRVAAGPDAAGLLLSPGSAAAVCLVSTIPWATTTRLPRFSGAIGWLLIVATVTLATPRIFSPGAEHSIEDWSSWMWTAGTVLLYPPLLVGRSLHASEALMAMPALLFAACALSLAFWSADRRDIPLEAAQ